MYCNCADFSSYSQSEIILMISSIHSPPAPLITHPQSPAELIRSGMWSFKLNHDPLCTLDQKGSVTHDLESVGSLIVNASAPINEFILLNKGDLSDAEVLDTFAEGGRAGRVTLAHLVAQLIRNSAPAVLGDFNGRTCGIEPLHLMRRSSGMHRNRKVPKRARSSKKPSSLLSPYILERSDIWCNDTTLNINVALIFQQGNEVYSTETTPASTTSAESLEEHLLTYFQGIEKSMIPPNAFFAHVGNTILQENIRKLLPSKDAVSFLANGSIMPRKSGASFAPMSSPPAIPFVAPGGSGMTQKIVIEMGKLCKYLKNENLFVESTKVTIEGLLVPKGVTLIVGGGYHGKSTMLKTIMTGVYNRVLGDGRELCVTDSSAVTVRAEDGRYVNNTNVSAFISNLPIVGSDTRSFSTGEASGSTSQAANVSEAIEMKAGAILVDEDVSAANFMSRDGRMRSLVMDESITPLLYRVNGLYDKHGISSIVVVGGVGDWLDVPNAVIKLDRYVPSDALEKAQSISRQFSHNQVQYGGRGVVHRLPWDGEGTPCRRHPVDLDIFGDINSCNLTLLDGGGKLSMEQAQDMHSDEEMDGYDSDNDMGIIDLTRCEQILGGKWQLFGCGICALWILRLASSESDLDLNELVDKLESTMDSTGLASVINSLSTTGSEMSTIYCSLLENLGHAYRPRRYEILMTLTRLRGIVFGELPTEVDVEALAVKREAEERKRALAELWANRRKK